MEPLFTIEAPFLFNGAIDGNPTEPGIETVPVGQAGEGLQSSQIGDLGCILGSRSIRQDSLNDPYDAGEIAPMEFTKSIQVPGEGPFDQLFIRQ